MINFKTVNTFKDFTDRLPGTINLIEEKFSSGDMVYCIANEILYRVGTMGSYSSGAIVNITDDQLVSTSGIYDEKILYKNKDKLYLWDNINDKFIAVSGNSEINASEVKTSDGSNVQSKLDALEDKTTFVGTILYNADVLTAPSGFLKCDGSLLDKNIYSDLANYLGPQGDAPYDYYGQIFTSAKPNGGSFAVKSPDERYYAKGGSTGFLEIFDTTTEPWTRLSLPAVPNSYEVTTGIFSPDSNFFIYIEGYSSTAPSFVNYVCVMNLNTLTRTVWTRTFSSTGAINKMWLSQDQSTLVIGALYTAYGAHNDTYAKNIMSNPSNFISTANFTTLSRINGYSNDKHPFQDYVACLASGNNRFTYVNMITDSVVFTMNEPEYIWNAKFNNSGTRLFLICKGANPNSGVRVYNTETQPFTLIDIKEMPTVPFLPSGYSDYYGLSTVLWKSDDSEILVNSYLYEGNNFIFKPSLPYTIRIPVYIKNYLVMGDGTAYNLNRTKIQLPNVSGLDEKNLPSPATFQRYKAIIKY